MQQAKPILERAYKNIGYEVIFKFTSFERSLLLSSTGQTDGEIFRFKEVVDKYTALYIVDEPLFYINTLAYVGKPNVIINGWEDIASYKIAIVRGVKAIEDKTKNFDVVLTNTHKEAFILLKRGSVDIVISGEITADKIIKEEGFEWVILSSFILDKKPVYHLIHKSKKEIIPELKKSIIEAKKIALFI